MPERPCAFHPDRLTLVGCSRCDRPICPQDMIDAPVGIQCPVCAGRMREGPLGEAAYRARERAERLPGARLLTRGSVTHALIAINVGVFGLMFLSDPQISAATLYRYGALPGILMWSDWWRLLTAMFVHVSMFHLLFNMLALFLFGRSIELRYGKVRFIGLYLAAGLLGSALSLALNDAGLRAGASGGVFGIVGAWIAVYARHHRMSGARDQLRGLLFLVGINLAIGATAGGIDNWAHLGGVAGGFAIALTIELTARRAPHVRALSSLTAYTAVLVVALALIAPNTLR